MEADLKKMSSVIYITFTFLPSALRVIKEPPTSFLPDLFHPLRIFRLVLKKHNKLSVLIFVPYGRPYCTICFGLTRDSSVPQYRYCK
jgi:hypothetical protein